VAVKVDYTKQKEKEGEDRPQPQEAEVPEDDEDYEMTEEGPNKFPKTRSSQRRLRRMKKRQN
jgi:hypothetical protein